MVSPKNFIFLHKKCRIVISFVFILLCISLTSVAYAAIELPPIYVSPSGGAVSPQLIEEKSIIIPTTYTTVELPPIYVSPSGGGVSPESVEEQSQRKDIAVDPKSLPEGWQMYDDTNVYNNQPTLEEDKFDFNNEAPFSLKKSNSKYGFEETSSSNDQTVSSYLKNFNYGITVQTDQKPNYYFEGVLPLYQSINKRNTFFTHNRISIQGDNEGSFSGGFGYRQLILDDELMVGANSFFDYQQNHDHSRLGFGLEAFSNEYEVRGNLYFGLSPRRLVQETESFFYYEKVADGYDFEAGGGYPEIPWLKTFFGFSKYIFEHSADELKITGRMQIKPSEFVTFNITGNRNQTTDSNQFGFDGRLTLPFATFKPEDLWVDFKEMWKLDHSEHFKQENLIDRVLDRVERNFNIVVEKTSARHSVVGNLNNIQLIVRFPGVVCGTPNQCLDNNSNGVVDAGDGFEIDFLLTNVGTQVSTGISYSNAQVSTGWAFAFNTDATLSDVPVGGTTRTTNVSDLDLPVPAGTAGGTQFTITLDVTADGQTATLTFGPFTVGSISDAQIFGLSGF